MSDNIIHCWPNRIDEATLTNVSGTYDANWPMVNMQNSVLAKVARTTSTGNITIGITLPETRIIGVVNLANHNLSVKAECRVSVYKDATKAILRNSPAWEKVWPRVYQSTALIWTATNWWYGRAEEEQRLSFTHLYTYFTDSNVESKYIEIEISDSTNAAGYFEIGRIFIGQVLQPTINPEYGKINYGYIDQTEVAEATDGTEYFYQKRKRRTVNFSLNHMTLDEAFGAAYDSFRAQGISGEILHAFSKVPTTYSYARTFLSRYSAMDSIGFPYINAYEVNFQLREVV